MSIAVDAVRARRQAIPAAMHGSLLHGLKRFVIAREGAAGWDAIVHAAKVQGWYKSSQSYPDEEFLGLVRALSEQWHLPISAILGEFGAALVPTLMGLYGAFVVPAWRTLDLLVNVETVIHRTVRMMDRLATPPLLRPRRISSNEVEIEYSSERRLCGMAVGICFGVAAHYDEKIVIAQPECMDKGHAICRLRIQLQP